MANARLNELCSRIHGLSMNIEDNIDNSLFISARYSTVCISSDVNRELCKQIHTSYMNKSADCDNQYIIDVLYTIDYLCNAIKKLVEKLEE